jgi:thiol-disulfide isomerase/thioredoxin
VHYRHALAPLRETATKDRDGIYGRYFRAEPVRTEHEEYMHHFLDFYDRYLVDFARRFDSILDLEEVLRYEKRPGPILEALKAQEADHMGTQAIRELVVVDGMVDAFYHRKPFDKEGIHAVLDSMALNASKKGIRRIAENVRTFISRRQRGSKAPSFRLMDADTNLVTLEDLRGSPVYINFWATWNETSLKDMRLIARLHERYGEHVRFVSICTDDKLRDMKRFLEEHPDYDWTFLYLGAHDEVEEAYQVASIPAYYFVNARGRFISVPAPKPGENARKRIHTVYERIGRRKARDRKRGWDH